MLAEIGATHIEADVALAPLASHQSLLLAVSGGPDSVALMLLAARWSARGARDVAVATIDHGLRAGSGAEALRVGEWARALGFAHHLLTWRGDKPATRIQERAREARYALLTQCAKKLGASAIVTAHHADDQAETVLFRLTRGSGVGGLAGMSMQTRCGDVALLRPLLGERKAALEEICASARHDFFRDPANENEIFARARLRKLNATLAAQGLDVPALLRLSARAARADAALTQCAQQAAAQALIARDSTQSRWRVEALRAFSQEILQRLLAAEIARLATPAPIRLERLERAAQRLMQAFANGAHLRITLADALIDARADVLTLRPAPPRRSDG